MDVNKQKILDFIKNKKLTVLSTINSRNRPESAVVAFSETDRLELIFGTFNTTRKYRNLQNNKNVALVIGWDEKENITVQYEGLAKEVENKEFEKLIAIHLNKNPFSKTYAFDDKQKYFKITPKWIRYSNLSVKPKEVFEIGFD